MTTLTGRLTVALPPDEAYELFTPRGEQRWVPGWRPRFPDAGDDTVFETEAHDEVTTWLVLEREPGRRLRYARVTPGSRAGTVTVTLDGPPEGPTEVEVTYALTALTRAARHHLAEFAATYPAYLASWQTSIAALGT